MTQHWSRRRGQLVARWVALLAWLVGVAMAAAGAYQAVNRVYHGEAQLLDRKSVV